MNKAYQTVVGATALVLAMGATHAGEFRIGQQLTPKQIASLTTQTLTVGTQQLGVLAVEPDIGTGTKLAPTLQGSTTTVVNKLGAVGQSRNEVMVGQIAPAEVESAVQALGLATVSESYFNSTRISVLRFESFEGAVQARNALVQLMPKASVSVPVQYAPVVPR